MIKRKLVESQAELSAAFRGCTADQALDCAEASKRARNERRRLAAASLATGNRQASSSSSPSPSGAPTARPHLSPPTASKDKPPALGASKGVTAGAGGRGSNSGGSSTGASGVAGKDVPSGGGVSSAVRSTLASADGGRGAAAKAGGGALSPVTVEGFLGYLAYGFIVESLGWCIF